MPLRPIHDQVVVELDPEQEKTKSGLILGAAPKDAPKSGTVRAVGPGFKTEDGYIRVPAVLVGERVLLRPRAGVEIEEATSDVKRVVLRDQELLGVLED